MGSDALVALVFSLEDLRNFYGRDDLDGNNSWKIEARVNYPTNTAVWDGLCKCIEISVGDTTTYYPWTPLDVVAHEVNHGLQGALNVLTATTAPETASLAEAYADVFGHEVWYRYTRGNGMVAAQPGDYWFGTSMFRANWVGGTFNKIVALRYMDDPQRSDPSLPVCYSSAIATMEAHHAMLPFDHMYYLLSNGGVSKCNGATVTPIGRDAAWKIAYNALVQAGPNPTYSQTKLNWMSIASTFYGGSTATLVQQAFDAINVP